MPQVLISTSTFGQVSSAPLEKLDAAGCDYQLNPYARQLEPQETVELLEGVQGLIAGTELLDRSVLEGAPALRVISRCGTGLENIDLDASAEMGIAVFNTPEAHVDAVAELTLAGILGLLRHVRDADVNLRRGLWKKPMGRLLRAKTVGIVGLGRIGTALVRLLEPFETRLLAFDLAPNKKLADKYRIEYLALEDLLTQADIVTIHLPLTSQTRGLFDRRILESIKPGAVLVNIARGDLVDEDALAGLLRNGHLAGAYLDVFEREPYEGPLSSVTNTLLTPHMGSYAAESRLRMETEAVENLLRFFAKESNID